MTDNKTFRTVLALVFAVFAFISSAVLAQEAPTPAQLGITPTTDPEVLQLLDKNRNWVTIGCVTGGTFTFATDCVPFTVPLNTTLPVISGDPLVGSTLTANPGIWSANPDPTFAYQWLRDGVNIAGATSSTYLIVADDSGTSINVIVAASNTAGFGTPAVSNALAITTALQAPANTALPLISDRAPIVGETLTATSGAWTGNPTPTFAYQWNTVLAGVTTPISGATTSGYITSSVDEGKQISVKVTATNFNSVSVTSDVTSPVVNVPVNTALPIISDTTPDVGETLTTTNGTWTLVSPISAFTYQWNTVVSGVPTPISGATLAGYTVASGDAGKQISVKVTATNLAGSVSVTSLVTSVVNNVTVAPVNTAAPVISGTPTIGQTLTLTGNTWTGTPTPVLSYQWLQNGVAIPGAGGPTYLVDNDDGGTTLSVTVTGTNTGGTLSVTSAATGSVTGPPFNLGSISSGNLPSISGTPRESNPLTATPGVWAAFPAPTYTYQWFRNGTTSLTSATTSPNYTPITADVGANLSVTVVATNSFGSGTATSNQVGPVAAALTIPANSVKPLISGVPQVGQSLSTTNGMWSGNPVPTFGYQWLRNGANITLNGTNQTYTIVTADSGASISVKVTATNSQGVVSATSSNAFTVTTAPVNTALPAISGTLQVGQVLTASNGVWTGSPAPTFGYQWLKGGANITGATLQTYTPITADGGAQIAVKVTATNSTGTAFATSLPVTIAAVTTTTHYMYFAVAPSVAQPVSPDAPGIYVYNIDSSHTFVEKIAFPASAPTVLSIRGIMADPVRKILYISYFGSLTNQAAGHLLAMNIQTGVELWHMDFAAGQPALRNSGVDRGCLTPDGKTIYLPTGETVAAAASWWYQIDVSGTTPSVVRQIPFFQTGTPLANVVAGAHNTICGQNGLIYMASVGKIGDISSDTTNDLSLKIYNPADPTHPQYIGQFAFRIRPFTLNGTGTEVFVNQEDYGGFGHATVAGNAHAQIPVGGGYVQPPVKNSAFSHGIAESYDNRFVWIADSNQSQTPVRHGLHLWQQTSPTAFTYIGYVPTGVTPTSYAAGFFAPGWIMGTIDNTNAQGKQFLYLDTGEVIDTTHNTAGTIASAVVDNLINPATGNNILSSRYGLEVDYSGTVQTGTPIRAGDQFVIGQGPSTPPTPPVNTSLPVITGAPQVGQTLSVSNGGWDPTATSYVYQWLKNSVAISGATHNTYTPEAGTAGGNGTTDVGTNISAKVTASNAAVGSGQATSLSVGPVTAPSTTIALPDFSSCNFTVPTTFPHVWYFDPVNGSTEVAYNTAGISLDPTVSPHQGDINHPWKDLNAIANSTFYVKVTLGGYNLPLLAATTQGGGPIMPGDEVLLKSGTAAQYGAILFGTSGLLFNPSGPFITFKPAPGATVTLMDISITGTNFLAFSGITLQSTVPPAGQLLRIGTQNVVFDNMTLAAVPAGTVLTQPQWSTLPTAIDFRPGSCASVTHSHIFNVGTGVQYAGGTQVKFDSNEIDHVSQDAMDIDGVDLAVTNNYIHDFPNGGVGDHIDAIQGVNGLLNAPNNRISFINNNIYWQVDPSLPFPTGSSINGAIDWGGNNNNNGPWTNMTVVNNKIYWPNFQHGISMDTTLGAIVENNTLGGGYIVTNGGDTNILIKNNLNSGMACKGGDQAGVQMQNNVMFQAHASINILCFGGTALQIANTPGTYLGNNLLDTGGPTSEIPGFNLSALTYNFALSSTAQARHYGLPVDFSPPVDSVGNPLNTPPDAGALQFH